MISKDIRYIGVNDHDIDLFEGQYSVPNGMSYNSYLILDEKIAVMDTVDASKGKEFMSNLERELGDRSPDYLVVHHMEPDHAANIQALVERYPQVRIVASAKALQMMPLYFDLDFIQTIPVKEGDVLNLGHHKLTFLMAPMVHWPEVMFSYESTEKVLFSADGFGKFGALDVDEPWDDESRRYYFNIVGKYGPQVQTVLKKAAALDIQTICPLHGPVLKENLSHYIDLYQTWSSYSVESEGVFIAYASIHGNTAEVAHTLKELLEQHNCPHVTMMDLTRNDMSAALANAFRYGKMILCASSYNANVMPAMENFLHHLQGKNFQHRTVGLVENGSWAPSANRTMTALLASMKDVTVLPETVTIRGKRRDSDLPALEALVQAILK